MIDQNEDDLTHVKALIILSDNNIPFCVNCAFDTDNTSGCNRVMVEVKWSSCQLDFLTVIRNIEFLVPNWQEGKSSCN